MNVILGATFHATKAALPGMLDQGWGRIVNTGSMHALVASPFKSAYNAAKVGGPGQRLCLVSGGAAGSDFAEGWGVAGSGAQEQLPWWWTSLPPSSLGRHRCHNWSHAAWLPHGRQGDSDACHVAGRGTQMPLLASPAVASAAAADA